MTETQWPPAKLHFHIALGAFICPLVAVPLVWTLALVNRLHPGTSEAAHSDAQRAWTRRLTWLAVIDTVLAVLLFATIRPNQQPVTMVGGPSAELQHRVIGIALDPKSTEPRVDGVESGYPAERAGVKAGDVIRKVNETPVTTLDEARQEIAATPEGKDVRLELQRDQQRLRLTMPVVTIGGAKGKGLFRPESPICTPLRRSGIPWGLLLVAAASIALYVAGRRKKMNAALIGVALSLFVIASITELVAFETCRAVGGSSRGGMLLAIAVQTVLVLLAGAILIRRVPPLPTPPQPHWFRIALRGALYMLGGGIRVGIALLALMQLAGGAGAAESPFQNSPIHELGQSVSFGPGGMLLFAIPVAIIGPIGEELLFRGVVLPWLVAWMSEKWALIFTTAMFAVLHLYYGPFVLVIFVYGLVLGWARLRSGTLKASILLHISLNSMATALLFLSSR